MNTNEHPHLPLRFVTIHHEGDHIVVDQVIKDVVPGVIDRRIEWADRKEPYDRVNLVTTDRTFTEEQIRAALEKAEVPFLKVVVK